MDLRVFAGHLVSDQRQLRLLPHRANHIEIRPRRFDHDHVRAFPLVQFHLAQRFADISRIELVGCLGNGLALRAAHRVTERTVIRRGELSRVSENARIRATRRIERGTDCPNASIHHVGGSHNIGARLGFLHRQPAKHFHRRIVVHITPILRKHAVVTVIGVRIKRDVGDEHQFGHRRLHLA